MPEFKVDVWYADDHLRTYKVTAPTTTRAEAAVLQDAMSYLAAVADEGANPEEYDFDHEVTDESRAMV